MPSQAVPLDAASADTAPSDTSTPAMTPFHTAQWSTAWRRVTTETVTHSHILTWPNAARPADHLPYYRVANSPLWTAMERDAGVTAPVWPGAVTYARTMYGEYGGLPGAAPAALASAVDRGLVLASRWKTAALVVSNLTFVEAQRWAAIRRPDATVIPYWAHRAQLNPSIEEFVTADQEHRKARRELRRQWKRGTEAGLQSVILRGPAMLPFLPDIVRQARATSERHGPALYGMDMLAPLVNVPGAVAIVADHPAGMAGAFVGFEEGDTTYLWTAAVDQTRKRALNTYAWLMYSALDYACARGATTVDAGRGNYRYKANLGLTAEPLTCLVYLTAPDPALIARLEAMHRGLDRHAHLAWTRTRSAARL